MPSSGPGSRAGGTRPGSRGSRARVPAAERTADGSSVSPPGGSVDGSGTGAGSSGRRPPRTPRLTGRAAILVLVLAVLTVSYASSLRAYLQQRAHIGDLKAQIVEREQNINDLEREKRRWEDPAYVRAQARERFGYLMPGETGFEVIGPDGKPLEPQATLNDPDEVIRTAPTAWWSAAWDSMELAGNPPAPTPGPADLVDGTKVDGGSDSSGDGSE